MNSRRVTLADIAARAGVSASTVSQALNGHGSVSRSSAARIRQAAEELGWTKSRRARITIADVAREAGVSVGSASNALNGRQGVAPDTRRKVLEAADMLGWSPNTAARMLSAARSETLGLVLARPARLLGAESFYMVFVSGIESVLADRGLGLLLQVVSDIDEEQRVYRRWSATRRVDGVVVVDLRNEDPRIDVLNELRMPAVIAGDPPERCDIPSLGADERSAMTEVLRYLFALGHRRIGRVAGSAQLGHVAVRDDEFLRLTRDAGTSATIVHADFTGEGGGRATRALLSQPERPSAILYDNDIMAVAGLSVASELSLRVPDDVSLVAWDDSELCRVTHPALSAVALDVHQYGRSLAQMLLEILDNGRPTTHELLPLILRPRGSTAPAPDRP